MSLIFLVDIRVLMRRKRVDAEEIGEELDR